MEKIKAHNIFGPARTQDAIAKAASISRQSINKYLNDTLNDNKLGVVLKIVRDGNGLTNEQLLDLRLGDFIYLLPE